MALSIVPYKEDEISKYFLDYRKSEEMKPLIEKYNELMELKIEVTSENYRYWEKKKDEITKLKKEIENERQKFSKPVNSIKDKIQEFFKEGFIDPLELQGKIIENGIQTIVTKLLYEAEMAKRKAEEKAAELQKEIDERKFEQAVRLEDAGNSEAAKELLEQNIIVPVIVPESPKYDKRITRKSIKILRIESEKLIKWIIKKCLEKKFQKKMIEKIMKTIENPEIDLKYFKIDVSPLIEYYKLHPREDVPGVEVEKFGY